MMMMNGMDSGMTDMSNMNIGQMGNMSQNHLQNAQGMVQGYMPGMQGHATGQVAIDMATHGAAGAHGASGATNILSGTDITGLLTSLFNLAINIFIILLAVGLIVGTVVYIKRLLTGSGQGLIAAKASCTCGQTLEAHWNVCPKCGAVKVTNSSINTTPTA